jgi:lipoprotein signal peptidase
MKLSKGVKSIIIILVMLTIDQVSKILVKTNMTIGESIYIFTGSRSNSLKIRGWLLAWIFPAGLASLYFQYSG